MTDVEVRSLALLVHIVKGHSGIVLCCSQEVFVELRELDLVHALVVLLEDADLRGVVRQRGCITALTGKVRGREQRDQTFLVGACEQAVLVVEADTCRWGRVVLRLRLTVIQ